MSDVDQAEQAEAAREPKVIKRYTNRKLYDTVESRYVTLDEIADMVKQGVEVRIVDNRSKDDLTSVTLAQIIFEEEKKKNQMPLSVLREIIRRPGESLTGFFQKEVGPRVASFREEAEKSLDKLLRRDDKREDGPRPEVGAPAALDGTSNDLVKSSQRVFEDWQRRIDEQVKLVLENFTGNLPALGRDLQSLLEKLEALEARLEALEKNTKK